MPENAAMTMMLMKVDAAADVGKLFSGQRRRHSSPEGGRGEAHRKQTMCLTPKMLVL